MPRKTLTITRVRANEKANTISVINSVANEISKSGIRVMPSAKDQLTKYLLQARRKGTLTTNQEIVIGASALITASAEISPKRKITTKDIDLAWEKLRRCPGNLPPPKCMRRSIIEHERTLRTELHGFAEIVDAIKK